MISFSVARFLLHNRFAEIALATSSSDVPGYNLYIELSAFGVGIHILPQAPKSSGWELTGRKLVKTVKIPSMKLRRADVFPSGRSSLLISVH